MGRLLHSLAVDCAAIASEPIALAERGTQAAFHLHVGFVEKKIPCLDNLL